MSTPRTSRLDHAYQSLKCQVCLVVLAARVWLAPAKLLKGESEPPLGCQRAPFSEDEALADDLSVMKQVVVRLIRSTITSSIPTYSCYFKPLSVRRKARRSGRVVYPETFRR